MKNSSENTAEVKTAAVVETHTPGATSPAKTTAKVTTVNHLTDLGITESGKANGKPRYLVNSNAVINLHSGFEKKLLCDGPTFTAGHACGFSCTFCYVESMFFSKNTNLQAIAKEAGKNFEDFVVDIADAPTKARKSLTKKNGKPKFADPIDQRVIFASPLVDVAANMGQVGVTVDMLAAIIDDKKAWETSAQKTFEALAEVIPAEKLRFLQYVNAGNLAWWNARKNQGAVLLAKVRKAKKTKKATK